MSLDLLYCCRMVDESDSFEIVPEFLSALEMEFSTWEDRENRRTIQTVYAETEEAGRENHARLCAAVPEWREMGVSISDPEYFELKREDWSEIWKQFFPVLNVSDHMVIKPTWREYTAKPGDCVIEIDPGMSFGTGQHATTAFCLRMLEKYAV
ncbi:MAG: 50S ribosomal protein L11 methyltransferase, partial [Lentisphaeria bacterium]|nr:50S ribosomal protein L11 methyltransferase [Lentisphaeria bacterium]